MTRVEAIATTLRQIRDHLERIALGLERSNMLAEQAERRHQAWLQDHRDDSASFDTLMAEIDGVVGDAEVIEFPRPRPPAA